jgi:hypothetical protein
MKHLTSLGSILVFLLASNFLVPTAVATVDVQPLNVTLGSSSVTAGGSLLVSWQIANNGTGTAGSSNSQVRITISNAAGGYGSPTKNVGSAQAGDSARGWAKAETGVHLGPRSNFSHRQMRRANNLSSRVECLARLSPPL